MPASDLDIAMDRPRAYGPAHEHGSHDTCFESCPAYNLDQRAYNALIYAADSAVIAAGTIELAVGVGVDPECAEAYEWAEDTREFAKTFAVAHSLVEFDEKNFARPAAIERTRPRERPVEYRIANRELDDSGLRGAFASAGLSLVEIPGKADHPDHAERWGSFVRCADGGELDAADLRCVEALLGRGYPVPLFNLSCGNVGPYAGELLRAWARAGVGGACVRCLTTLEEGWCGAQCPTCERHYAEAKGCRCGGLNLCPDCQRAGATPATRGVVKCNEDCSSLCGVCCPDD